MYVESCIIYSSDGDTCVPIFAKHEICSSLLLATFKAVAFHLP